MERRTFLAHASSSLSWLAGFQSPSEKDYVSLFDGVSRSGWTVQDGPDSDYRFRNGWIETAPGASPHSWLRSIEQYENFDFQCDFFIEGWMEGGIYLHAPEHGRNTWVGMMIKIFRAPELGKNSIGAVFPVVRPLKAVVRNRGEWNQIRVLMDWPRLKVWMNDEVVQDLDVESIPALRHRFRRGYLGLTGLATPLRFRNMRIRILPDKLSWTRMFETDGDLENWTIMPERPNAAVEWTAHDGVLRGVGSGNLVSRACYRDFELMAYVRAAPNCNSGVFFRTAGKGLAGDYYEVQIFNVPDAHYITGSLYGFDRGEYPHVQDEQWFPIQLWVKDRRCVVRVNGDTVVDYGLLENLQEGHVELQAHRADRWVEFKTIRIRCI